MSSSLQVLHKIKNLGFNAIRIPFTFSALRENTQPQIQCQCDVREHGLLCLHLSPRLDAASRTRTMFSGSCLVNFTLRQRQLTAVADKRLAVAASVPR
jgi:hypothetical protein